MSTTNSMKLDIYVNYPGHCKKAFQFYEQHLGGKITMMLTHQQQPNAANVPADWKDAILHARIEIGDSVLMGADIPNAEPMRWVIAFLEEIMTQSGCLKVIRKVSCILVIFLYIHPAFTN